MHSKRSYIIGIVSTTALASFASMASAQSQYFDTNSTTSGSGVAAGGTYTWEGSNWSADTGSTNPGGTGATQAWVDGEFARFVAGADAGTSAYTVNVTANHTCAGMYVLTGGGSVTLNGSGAIGIVSGFQGFLVSGSQNLVIKTKLTGVGGVQPGSGSGSGSLYLYGNNDYSGGTKLASTALLTYFNNSNSFGSGPINLAVAGYAPLLDTGGSAITIPNLFNNTVVGGGVNFGSATNTPVISTGNWTLGANNLVLRNNGGSTAPLTLTGIISGSAGVQVSGNNATGTINFNNVETYTGTTTIGVTGTSPSQKVALKLGVANAIASSSSLIMNGGTFDPGGVSQTGMTSTTLGLTSSSTITFSSGATEVDFADSSAVPWTAGTTLTFPNFDPSVDKVRFGNGTTQGLTDSQLALISFNGGTAQLVNGYLVPEPSTAALLGVGGLLAARRRRA